MFSLFVFYCSSIIYGADFGEEGVRISKADPETGFELVPSSHGRRSFPNLLGYLYEKNDTKPHWKFGHEGLIAKSKNISNTVKNPFKYLTRHDFPLKEIHQSVASALSIKFSLPNISNNLDQVYISIPSSSTPQYRSAFYQAAITAGIKDPQLIDQSTALASLYTVEKINKTIRSPSDVYFVDIGSRSMELTHWRITPLVSTNNVTLIKYLYTDKVSGQKFDDAIFKYVCSQIDDEISPELKEYLRSQIPKHKEVLSAVNETSIHIKCINKTITLTNDIIEEASKDIILDFEKAINKFQGTDTTQIGVIELFGKGTLLRCINSTLSKIYADVDIKRSYVNDDCVSLGAVYYGAIVKRLVPNTRLDLNRVSPFTIKAHRGNGSLSLVEAGTSLRLRLFNVLSNENFEFGIQAILPQNYKPFVDTEDSRNMPDLITTTAVFGFDKISSNIEEGKKFMINITLDAQKTLGHFKPTVVRALQIDTGRMWALGHTTFLSDPKLAIPENGDEIVSKAFAINKKSKKSTITYEIESLLADAEEIVKYDSDCLLTSTDEDREIALSAIEYSKGNITLGLKKGGLRKVLGHLGTAVRSLILRAIERKERPAALAMLREAIAVGEAELQKATADKTIIEKFQSLLDHARNDVARAEGADPMRNPILQCKDLIRRANNVMERAQNLLDETEDNIGRRKRNTDL